MTAKSLYELAPLPYAHNALSPRISRETMAYHYDRHHRAYVTSLNNLIVDSPLNGDSLEEIVRRAEGPLFNSAAQSWNHAFYWNCLSPERGQKPSAQLAAAIDRRFGSLSEFLQSFRTSALTKFGSGWTWLYVDTGGALRLTNSADADTPLRHGCVPLLTCDVWEHAYYLDYRNNRARYLDGFVELVNWEFASSNYAEAIQSFVADHPEKMIVQTKEPAERVTAVRRPDVAHHQIQETVR